MNATMSRETAIDHHRMMCRRHLNQARDASVIALGIVPNHTRLPRSAWRAVWRRECAIVAHHRRLLAVEKSYLAVSYANEHGAHYGAVAS